MTKAVFVANTEKIQRLTSWKPQWSVHSRVQEWLQNVFSQ